jgi:hypothetical protein
METKKPSAAQLALLKSLGGDTAPPPETMDEASQRIDAQLRKRGVQRDLESKNFEA